MGKVILRSNLTSGSIPQPSDLEVSELVLGGVDGRLWTKTPGNEIMLLNPAGAVAMVNAISASYALTSSFAVSASWAPGGAGSIGGSGTTNKISKFTAGTTIGDSSLTDTGTIISSSVPISGSSFTGSFNGNGAGITGVISSSYALTSSAATSITFTPVTASYAVTSSAATSITFTPATSSFATTSSWAPNRVKAGSVAAGSFTGNPKKATVTFTTAFPDTNYAAVITGEDARSWVIESKVAGSFVINAGSNTALVGTTYWIATATGEI